MAGAIQLTELDFDQIKQNLVDYLKSTKQFTDFDFEGSNLNVILDLIAYQAQLNAYNTNVIANESFLATSTIRNNVVANARMVGFLPSSASAADMDVQMSVQLESSNYPSGFPRFIQIQPGMVFTGQGTNESVIFNSLDVQTASVTNSGYAQWPVISSTEGLYLRASFTVNRDDFNQRFIIENQGIDVSSMRVEVQEDPNQSAKASFIQAKNLSQVDESSRVYWVEEMEDNFYELIFGDGLFGAELKNGAKINVNYVIGHGSIGNGIRGTNNISFIGKMIDSYGATVTGAPVTIMAVEPSRGGSDVESVDSIKFRAPREYAAQNRCVVADDYASIIKRIYPAIDDIYVYGGETMETPQYGRVFVAIKPVGSQNLSAYVKSYIKDSLNRYRIASMDIQLVDPEVVYVEVVSSVYFDNKVTNKDNASIIAEVKDSLSKYSQSSAVSRFGSAARFSNIVGIIDDTDESITRNNTFLRMRRDMTILPDTYASYELCFENEMSKTLSRANVYSTGFKLLGSNGVDDGITYYFEDDGGGKIQRFYLDVDNQKIIVDKDFGTIDYVKGELKIGYDNAISFTSTSTANSVIEVRAFPLGQDVLAEKSVSVNIDVSKSDIISIIDTDTSV